MDGAGRGIAPGPSLVIPNPLMDPSGVETRINCRLFDANDPESTGIARLRPESLDDQSPCGTPKIRNHWTCPDLSAAHPLVAGSSPARPTSEAPNQRTAPSVAAPASVTASNR